MILCIETATTVCSAALCEAERVVSLRESHDTRSHASLLTVFITGLLKENSIKAGDLEAVAVTRGPGSYTGLRIGVSVAKGIAYRAGIPLIGIETTTSMFHGISETRQRLAESHPEIYFCPMIDARRMEVYYSVIDKNGRTVKEISAEVIEPGSFSGIPEQVTLAFFGEGASKCRNIISRRNVIFIEDFSVSASHMRIPAFEAARSKKFEDIAYFEPFYLKNFIATIPKKNLIS
jgi:tRNA threonylcarbamoyladenosine biosynthesis protein TsaB